MSYMSNLLQNKFQKVFCCVFTQKSKSKERLSLDTLAALSQDGEKLMISKSLRNAPSALQSQLDQAIRIVIGQRGLTMQAGLTHQDYYYQKISQIDQIMATFASLVQNSITNSKDRVGKVCAKLFLRYHMIF